MALDHMMEGKTILKTSVNALENQMSPSKALATELVVEMYSTLNMRACTVVTDIITE